MPLIRQMTRKTIQSASRLLSPDARDKVGQVGVFRRLNLWAKSSERQAGSLKSLDTRTGQAPPTNEEQKESAYASPVASMGNKPSYRYKLEELKRRRRQVAEIYELQDPLFTINDKYKAYDFADHHGIDHPKVFGAYESIEEVEWDRLPRSFVLKTRWGSSNKGVRALVRDDEGGFLDLLRSRRWTIQDIVADQQRKESETLVSRSMFAEELILKPDGKGIADDWKFYCFDGQVGLSMQRDVRGSGDLAQWRFKFRDRDWNDLGPIKFIDRLDESLPPPRDPEALTALAEKLSSLIGRPFIRVDLFEAERGPVLGEFTPEPGPPEVFSPEIDEMLGSLWEAAEAKHFARAIESGVWSHVDY